MSFRFYSAVFCSREKSKEPKKKQPEKRGRKPIVIDYEKVKQYAAMGLTKEEIGLAMGLGKTRFFYYKKTDANIDQAIQQGRATFKVFLSNTLIDQAKKGNVTAAIWLDKTRCGTREIKDINISTTAILPTKIIYEDQ